MRKILFVAIKDMYSSIERLLSEERLLAEKASGETKAERQVSAPKKQAIIVGRLEQGGEVICSSPEAKEFGIYPGMPVSRARRRVPPATDRVKFVRFDPEKYRPYYEKVRRVLDRYSPQIEPATFRETYVDITGCEDLFGPPEVIAQRIAKDIREESGLDAFVGCSTNKLIAKLACLETLESADRIANQTADRIADRTADKTAYRTVDRTDTRRHSPKSTSENISERTHSSSLDQNFFLEVTPDDVPAFLQALSLSRLDEFDGEVRNFLDRVGVRTFGALARISRSSLKKQFGEIGDVIFELARGVDERPVSPRPVVRSLSVEASYNPDLAEEEDVLRELFKLSEEVAYKLRSKTLKGNVIILKLTLSNLKELVLKKVQRSSLKAAGLKAAGSKASSAKGASLKAARAESAGTDVGAVIYRISEQAYLKSRLGNKRIKKICLQVSGFGSIGWTEADHKGADSANSANRAADQRYQQPSLFSIYALSTTKDDATNGAIDSSSANWIPGMDRSEILRQTSDKLRNKFGKNALFPAKTK